LSAPGCDDDGRNDRGSSAEEQRGVETVRERGLRMRGDWLRQVRGDRERRFGSGHDGWRDA
jgi:hypothetical protein